MSSIEAAVAEALWQDGTMHNFGPETLAHIAVDAATPGIKAEILRDLEDVEADRPAVNFGPATYAFNAGWREACEAMQRKLAER